MVRMKLEIHEFQSIAPTYTFPTKIIVINKSSQIKNTL